MALADVLPGQALDDTESLLAPQRLGQGRGLPLARQGLGRLPRAQQVAGQQGAWRMRSQVLAQALGLPQAQGVERRIQMALETQLAVPIGFAVSHQPQIDHAGIMR